MEETKEVDWFIDKWGWYNTIDELFAKGDRSKYDYYFKMNIYDFLNHLSFLNDKQNNTKKYANR